MDERRPTQLIGRRDGRALTVRETEVSKSALDGHVRVAISKIELLAFRTNFDYRKRCGEIPVNVSLFSKEEFFKALQSMRATFAAGLCVSDMVAVASEGERLGELSVPKGKIGLATVCSIVLNGALLKAGVPIDCRFGGILQIRNHKPLRFVELIYYTGCSLDPSEIFIRAGMTSVKGAASNGHGNILANFREIPAICRPIAEEILAGLSESGLRPLMAIGGTSLPVCETSVDLNKIGMVLLGGLNPVASAEEAGIMSENHAMSTTMEYQDLIKFERLLK